MGTIEERVRYVVNERLDVDCKNNDSLIYDLSADSLDIVELTMDLEKEFDVRISDEDAVKFITVNDIIDYFVQLTPTNKEEQKEEKDGLKEIRVLVPKNYEWDNKTYSFGPKKEFPKSASSALMVEGVDDTSRKIFLNQLHKLLTIRDAWWKLDNDWDPTKLAVNEALFTITYNYKRFNVKKSRKKIACPPPLFVFRTYELAQEFLNNFCPMLSEVDRVLING